MIVRLDNDEIWFPDPRNGEEDGLFAVGGDLSAKRLLLAYSHGIFPWYAFRQEDAPLLTDDGKSEILWYCPMDRFVIFPDEIHISHSMSNLMNKNKYRVTVDQAFDQVIKNCSEVNGRINHEGAWLGPEIISAYTELHDQGCALSIEVWNSDGELCGGLYGVTLGSSFFGESMFSHEPNTSKLALISLARLMQQNGLKLIDCQFETAHLKSMGGRHITYDEYMGYLSGEK